MRRIGVCLLALTLALAVALAFSAWKKTSVHLAMPTTTPYQHTLTKARILHNHRTTVPPKDTMPKMVTTAETTTQLASTTEETASTADQGPTTTMMVTAYPWEESASTSEMLPFVTETAYYLDELPSTAGETATSEWPFPTEESIYSTELTSTSKMPAAFPKTNIWDKSVYPTEGVAIISEMPELTSMTEGTATSEEPTMMEKTASTTEEALASSTKALDTSQNGSTTMAGVHSTMVTSSTQMATEASTATSTSVVPSKSMVTMTEAPTTIKMAASSSTVTEAPSTAKTAFTTVAKAPTKMASSTRAATTAAQHTPHAMPTVGNYTVQREGGILCVKAEMALQIRVAYRTIFKNMSEGIFIVQPSRTVAKGGCGETTATLHLKFEEGVIFFRFQKNMTTNVVYVSTLAFMVTYPFPNADPRKRTYSAKNESLQLFSTQLRHSYSCCLQSISLGRQHYVDIFQQRIQALDFTRPAFGPEDHCPMDQGSGNLTLILCILLLILIVAIAVACFIWRRKKLVGYQPL
ncbi:mucin-3A isoform X1 [Arapaima gigas]